MSNAMVFGPFIAMIFSLLGLFILYLIIRAAINNSELNKNVEALRKELRDLNEQIRSLKAVTKQDNN